jgi:transcription termination factor Rho
MTTTTRQRPAAGPGPASAAPSPAAPAAGPARAGSPDAGGDTLAAVSGILDTAGGNAFIRTSGYRVSPDDTYVPASLVRQYGLRRGDHIEGAAGRPGTGDENRPSRKNQASGGRPKTRQKAGALARVDTVNGLPAAGAGNRPDFDALTPLYASERLRLEAGSSSATARIIDLVSPVGKGQRGLIVAPPKAGKTMVLKGIASAITAGHPEVHLMMVLVGERPEEVTDIRRSVRGEVVYSTFDRSAQDHIMVAELAIERAKRLVELGRDVVVLLDSITRLARAYNLAAPASSRILAGGVATSALQPPRTFLGAARNVEEGGSLTILSSALIDTGSRMDDVFFEEFKGTGNMELRLRRDLAEKRLFPAIDVAASGTRRDDLLMAPDEYTAVGVLRRALGGLDAQQALELLIDRTRETSSNAEFLLQRPAPGHGAHGRGRQAPVPQALSA